MHHHGPQCTIMVHNAPSWSTMHHHGPQCTAVTAFILIITSSLPLLLATKMDDYARASLGMATAQICQSLGWHSVHRSSHDILTDVLERYLKNITKKTSSISNHSK